MRERQRDRERKVCLCACFFSCLFDLVKDVLSVSFDPGCIGYSIGKCGMCYLPYLSLYMSLYK